MRGGPGHQDADARRLSYSLLRACREGPRRRATEQRDELAALHLTTPSTSASRLLLQRATDEDSVLNNFAKDRLHVCLCKRSQRLRANISKGAAAQSKRGHGNVIWCLNNCDHVVLAQCPECILHVRPALFRHVFECLRPFRRILDIADSLIREA